MSENIIVVKKVKSSSSLYPQSGVVCCFEQTAELPLVESCTLPHPVTCLAWSNNYEKLAIGTQQVISSISDLSDRHGFSLNADNHITFDWVFTTLQGAIFLANPLKLSTGAILVSDHRLSPIVGINVLTPGFNHCVVSLTLHSLPPPLPP